jgi:hypothetical protein
MSGIMGTTFGLVTIHCNRKFKCYEKARLDTVIYLYYCLRG